MLANILQKYTAPEKISVFLAAKCSYELNQLTANELCHLKLTLNTLRNPNNELKEAKSSDSFTRKCTSLGGINNRREMYPNFPCGVIVSGYFPRLFMASEGHNRVSVSWVGGSRG